MKPSQVLSEMEQKLDELIKNANLLRDCEEENGQCADLQHQQDRLLNELMQMNNSLEETEKHQLLQKSPRLYSTLEQKISDFSRMNSRLLKSSMEKYVKKARVHRKKIEKPPKQLSMDF